MKYLILDHYFFECISSGTSYKIINYNLAKKGIRVSAKVWALWNLLEILFVLHSNLWNVFESTDRSDVNLCNTGVFKLNLSMSYFSLVSAIFLSQFVWFIP